MEIKKSHPSQRSLIAIQRKINFNLIKVIYKLLHAQRNIAFPCQPSCVWLNFPIYPLEANANSVVLSKGAELTPCESNGKKLSFAYPPTKRKTGFGFYLITQYFDYLLNLATWLEEEKQKTCHHKANILINKQSLSFTKLLSFLSLVPFTAVKVEQMMEGGGGCGGLW